MRTIVIGMLIVLVLGITTTCLWWNSTRIEAWAEDTKHEWKTEQDRQQVKHAEVFLRKGLAELGREIARLENVRYEHRVASEEARLRADKALAAVAEAENLAVEFLRALKSANGQPFDFCSRTYDAAQADDQFDALARETLCRRRVLDELHYEQVAHRQAAEHIVNAIKTLGEAKRKAEREGKRLVVDRDVADARALAQTLAEHGPAGTNRSGDVLVDTLKLLRNHLTRCGAEDRVRTQSGASTIDDIQQRKRETETSEELKRLKEELLKR
jgi:hypothetical protein